MNNKCIFALGFFDGVHIGHQALLSQCRRLAAERGCRSAAITFDRHPKALFTKEPPPLINSLSDRCQLLSDFGMEHIRCFPVTKDVMGKHWRDFLDELMQGGAAGFVCGYDFRFGCRGEGDAEKLRAYCREHNIPCVIVPEQELEGIRVSSTHIRSLLEQGDMQTAARFLGHPHILSGEVIPGRHLGRTIGVPTANIRIPEEVVLPRLGVYACSAQVNGQVYPAVTNIGSRPTVSGHQIRSESWLLGFEGDLYGQTLKLRFAGFLRPERKFESLEALRAAIEKDAAETVKRIRQCPRG